MTNAGQHKALASLLRTMLGRQNRNRKISSDDLLSTTYRYVHNCDQFNILSFFAFLVHTIPASTFCPLLSLLLLCSHLKQTHCTKTRKTCEKKKTTSTQSINCKTMSSEADPIPQPSSQSPTQARCRRRGLFRQVVRVPGRRAYPLARHRLGRMVQSAQEKANSHDDGTSRSK